MSTTPLSLVKDKFESKEKLVAAVQALASGDLWIDRLSEAKGLGRVSNAKLVRLHSALTDAKKRFGSRAKLIAAILEAEKRTADQGYKARLEAFPLPRLLDQHASSTRRAKRASAAPKAAPVAKKRVARSKKAKAKARAAS